MARRDETHDIVHDLLARVRAALPDLPESTLLSLERDVRLAWGGDKHYIAKPSREDKKRQATFAFCTEGKSIQEVVSETGISRRTLYRALAKKGG